MEYFESKGLRRVYSSGPRRHSKCLYPSQQCHTADDVCMSLSIACTGEYVLTPATHSYRDPTVTETQKLAGIQMPGRDLNLHLGRTYTKIKSTNDRARRCLDD
eukprot:2586110-Amphidinium_carterae.2